MTALAFLSDEARTELEALIAQRVAEEVETQLRERDGARQERPYMTIPEAAELMRCRRQRIDDLLSAGRLTRVKEGARTLVLRDEIGRHLGYNGGVLPGQHAR